MGIPLDAQLTAFLYAFLAGAICGILYDLIRVSRVFFGISRYTEWGRKLTALKLPLIGSQKRKTKTSVRRSGCLVALAVGDIAFSVVAGCAFCIFLYQAASGAFRWFYLLACGIGFGIYYITVGKAVMLSSEALAFLIRTALRYILWLLSAPFRLLYWFVRKLCRFLWRRVLYPLCSAFHYRRRVRYTRRVRAELPSAIYISGMDYH